MSFKRVVEPGKTASGRQRTMDVCCFTSTEIVGLLGTGAQDVHLDFHTPPELWFAFVFIPFLFIGPTMLYFGSVPFYKGR